MEVIRTEARRWNLKQIIMDSTGLGGQFARDIMYNEMLQEGIPVIAFNFTPVSKYHDLFLPYRVALEHEQVTFPENWTKLSSQLMDISHKETVNRGHVFGTISGKHDDWVDAEALALYGCDPVEYAQRKRTNKSFSGAEPLRPLNTMRKRKKGKLFQGAREERYKEVLDEIDMVINGEHVKI